MRHLFLILAPLALMMVTLEPAAAAAPQRLARNKTEVPSEGFEFKALDRFEAIPVDTASGGDEVLKLGKDDDLITVLSCASPEAKGSGKKGESVASGKRKSIEAVVAGLGYRGLSKKRIKSPELEEEEEIEGLRVQHRRYVWSIVDDEQAVLDVWSYPLSHADIHICYFVLDESSKKLTKTLEKSARSFRLIERVARVEVDASARTYESQMAWAENEAKNTPGWQAIGTPSKRFVILTSSTKKKFVDEVIKRLEISRDIYEADFPPPAGFNAVSIIRICGSQEEFMQFSKAGPNTGGYFAPWSVELVLYDNVEKDRNATYAVVSHEAFHQYCHFLFNESEAHRWFDEGHGDYYGGMKIKGSRGIITPKMPAGFDRLGVVRQMVQEESYTPMEEHLNYSHQAWRNQNEGSETGVSAYAQSWSIVYMLRQGALRKVNRKVWKDEYAEIVPNYVRTLTEGFEAAYEEIRNDRIAKAKKRGKELDPKDLKVNRFDLDPRQKKKIWAAAMEASWGQIDLEEFEENWRVYVKRFLKS
ncbi:MAG: hypothetical protein AAGG01_09340 [Planctomycetota bacterium]